VITQWNIGRLKEFLDHFKKFALDQVGFMHTNYTPDSVADAHNLLYGQHYHATASNMQDIDLAQYDLDLLHEEIKQIKQTDYPFKVTFSPEINSKEKLIEFYHEPEKLYGKKCHDVFSAIMIKSNGDVIPAHGRCYNLKVGNLYEQDLPAIWNSGVMARFRKDLNKAGGLLPACSRCCSAFS
jgi:radical SAM protein with 4Fe4S-binding SPASM domain